jgi:large subunit ribosomal protein L3
MMTQIPSSNGEIKAVTAIKVGENFISQVKRNERDGYDACQVAFEDCKEKSLNKPLMGHLNKANLSPKKHLKEIRGMAGELGSQVKLSNFKVGERIKVSGTSRGKGFAGVIKKYKFALGAMSHGGGYPHRLIGSMGGGAGTNQGIPKGKKMPGRMGGELVTQQAIIERIDEENQVIFLRGAVTGPRGGLLVLQKSL